MHVRFFAYMCVYLCGHSPLFCSEPTPVARARVGRAHVLPGRAGSNPGRGARRFPPLPSPQRETRKCDRVPNRAGEKGNLEECVRTHFIHCLGMS